MVLGPARVLTRTGAPPRSGWRVRRRCRRRRRTYISDVVTPGCTDGQARFELWLSGWGGEAWATASVGSVNESIGLVQCFVDVCTCEGVGAVPPGNLADQAADAGMYG